MFAKLLGSSPDAGPQQDGRPFLNEGREDSGGLDVSLESSDLPSVTKQDSKASKESIPPLPDIGAGVGALPEEGTPADAPPSSRSIKNLFKEGALKAAAAAKDGAAQEEGPVDVSEANAEIKVNSLEELCLPPEQSRDAQAAWAAFCNSGESREAAGEAIYSALFEGAPSLQSLFTTPRAVQAMRFMTGLNSFVQVLDAPPQLKILAETLGFGHLNLDVTVPRVVIFRDAILDLFDVELGASFTSDAREGWKMMLNYIGGAIIFVRNHYSDRLRILSESWAEASGKGRDKNAAAAAAAKAQQQQQQEQGGSGEASGEASSGGAGGGAGDGDYQDDGAPKSKRKMSFFRGMFKRKRDAGDGQGLSGGLSSPRGASGSPSQSPRGDGSDEHGEDAKKNFKKSAGGTTYAEMFHFNMAVMGLQSKTWMLEVLRSFDNIVSNVSNSARLQQECEVLALKISKSKGSASVNLAEYKSCMLAALRSALPKVWDSSYEVAWNWLWDNVERLLRKTLGSPQVWEAALARMMDSVTEDQLFEIRKSIYEQFFAAAPVGQDYFKQSNTRLHFIANRVLQMTLEIFKDPWQMVDDISALGLRHVGYAIPTELFGPFVTACIQVLNNENKDPDTIEGFRWALGLISKMLVTTINEGSTIVMKAINVNSTRMLKKAVSCAPRGQRATWLLLVQVGTQSISPLEWALQSGSVACAEAILNDLLTIRADRERYYYGMEELFARHPDIVAQLCAEGTDLLFTLMDGLAWRSRGTVNGMRRVNYYVKYLIHDHEKNFADALSHLVACKEPKIFQHPTVNIVSDTLWEKIVCWNFGYSKIWFVVSIFVFMMGQAILPKLHNKDEFWVRASVFGCRMFNYIFTMFRLAARHTREIVWAFRHGDVKRFARIPVPSYLLEGYEGGIFLLCILFILMCCNEPMLYCAQDERFPIEDCPASEHVLFRYSLFVMWGMLAHWMLLTDMAVFSTGLSAFVLVCGHVLWEIALFLIALLFVLLMFASAITVLEHSYKDMHHVGGSAVALFAITVRVYEDDYRDFQEDKLLLLMVFVFVVASAILLLNVLIAQLNCSYVYVYQNMVGFARLRRAEVICETLGEDCPMQQWNRFVESLGLETPLEFNAGDVGFAGGLTTEELGTLTSINTETIVRYGGSCSPDLQWPEDTTVGEEEEMAAKYDRMERLVQRALKKLAHSAGSSKARHSKLSGAGSPGAGNSKLSGEDSGTISDSGSSAGSHLSDG
mmetsp:Transcript_4707/g.13115  ORF Transcript_4707/g.13115 Transcript_4707/m.13115 type:complete len:1236 (-) Transcript_4707:77-3784(-)